MPRQCNPLYTGIRFNPETASSDAMPRIATSVSVAVEIERGSKYRVYRHVHDKRLIKTLEERARLG